MSELNAFEVELATARKIFWLLLYEHVFLGNYNHSKGDWDDGAYPIIDCSELFVVGADAERLAAEDLDDYIAVVKCWPNAGSYAWCSLKRSVEPWHKIRNSAWDIEYEEALAGIPALLKKRLPSLLD